MIFLSSSACLDKYLDFRERRGFPKESKIANESGRPIHKDWLLRNITRFIT